MDTLEDFWNDTGEPSSCDLWAAVSHVVQFSVSGTSLHLLRVATWFPAPFDPSTQPLVPSTRCMVHAFHHFFLHPASVLKLSLPLIPMTPPPTLTSNNPIQRSGGFGCISKTAFFGHRHDNFLTCLQVCPAWTDSLILYKATERYVHLTLSLYSLAYILQFIQSYYYQSVSASKLQSVISCVAINFQFNDFACLTSI